MPFAGLQGPRYSCSLVDSSTVARRLTDFLAGASLRTPFHHAPRHRRTVTRVTTGDARPLANRLPRSTPSSFLVVMASDRLAAGVRYASALKTGKVGETGEIPNRSRGSLAFATALPDLPSRRSRAADGGLRGPTVGPRTGTKVAVHRTLLTFAPTSSMLPSLGSLSLSALRPGVATAPSSCLSWGCPKIAPPSYSLEESTPRTVASPFGLDPARILPCSALVVSHHLDGLLLPARARVLHLADDHGVHHVSSRLRGESPRGAALPSEALLSAGSDDVRVA